MLAPPVSETAHDDPTHNTGPTDSSQDLGSPPGRKSQIPGMGHNVNHDCHQAEKYEELAGTKNPEVRRSRCSAQCHASFARGSA